MLMFLKLFDNRTFVGLLLPLLTFGFYFLGQSFPVRWSMSYPDHYKRISQVKNIYGACDDINWASWNNFAGNSAVGTIVDGMDRINVTMTSNFVFGSTPVIYNYAKFNSYPSPIPNSTVPMTEWSIGTGGITTMCFSRIVTNPVLLIASLGSSNGTKAKLQFSLPYVVLFDGGNMEYHNSTTLTGVEGYAIIMFPGDFNCVTINSSTPEYYSNITWGIRPPPFAIDIAENKSCGSTVLTASGGISYHWDGGDNPESAINTFRTSGTYIVTVTNESGCKTSASKQIVVDEDSPVYITEIKNGCANVSLTASGGSKYEWDGGASPLNATNTFYADGTYTVRVTHLNGCVTTTSKIVELNRPGSATIIGDLNACREVVLTASGGISYRWDGGETPDSAINKFTRSGKYTVVVTDLNGCNSDAEVDVVIQEPLIPSIDIQSTADGICPGSEVTFNTSVINEGEAPKFTWFKNNISVGSGTSYTTKDLKNGDEIYCELVNSNPCASMQVVASNKITAVVNKPPQITFNQELAIEENKPIQLNPIIEGSVRDYLWTPSNGLSNPFSRNPIANPLSTTTYKLKVTSVEGCESEWDVKVTVTKKVLTNVFSPNDDGINDTWNVDLSGYPKAELQIYNRYGNCLFFSRSASIKWEGRYNGQLLPSGVYFFVINYNYEDLKPARGTIVIL